MKKIFFTLSCMACICILHAQTLYGTTSGGGSGVNGKGTITKLVTSTNTLTSAFTFNDPSPDGRVPLYTTLVQASNGKLYGMTAEGGNSDYGTIFSYDPATAVYTKIFDFNGTNGATPNGSLIQASDGKLYGMTTGGGGNDSGVIFSFNPATTAYSKLVDLNGTKGYYPYGSLMPASDGKLYGMTTFGGSNDRGVIFSFNPSVVAYNKLKEFDSTNGAYPFGNLMQASDGKLYGMTNSGGSNDAGVLFSFNLSTNALSKLKDFSPTLGATPYGSLMQASDGKLYGLTYKGGSSRSGVLFSYAPSTAVYTKQVEFNVTNGAFPYGGLTQASDGKLYGMTNNGGTYNDGVVFSYAPSTSTYTKLSEFNTTNGSNPHGNLTQASNGKLYGVTRTGGGVNAGVIFSFNPSGAVYTKLKVFGIVPNGCNIVGGLVKVASGKLYGMFSNGGGINGLGGIFSYNPATNAYNKMVDFDNTNGANPFGSLTLASNGKLYGMTYNGGSLGYGVIFSLDPVTATYTKVKDLDSINGRNPEGNLTQASDGKLYGMTTFGGAYDAGVIFSFNPATAVYTKLADFDDDNGAVPYGSLTQASDGKLYGTTTFGGIIGAGVLFSYNPATAVLTKIMDFTGGPSGAYPYGSLTPAADSKLYGMTYSGGSSGVGVIFSFNPATATYAKVKDFDNTNGRSPRGSLTKAANGKLYGMTNFGGTYDYGVAFSYTPATATYTKLSDFNGTNGKYPMYTYFTEVPPSTTLKINNVNVQEGISGQKSVNFAVTLSAAASQTVTVNYTTKNNTATAPSDYVAQSGTLTFAPGVTQKTITVVINGDTQVEGDEKFKVLLSNPVNATFKDSIGVCTILNDDAAVATTTTANSSTQQVIVAVSPNPAINILNVQLNGYNGKIALQLTDMQGKVLKAHKLQVDRTQYKQQQFDVADVASGIYFLIIMDESGNKQTRKIVVSH